MKEVRNVQGGAPIKPNYDESRVSKKVKQEVNSILNEGKKIQGSADEVKALTQYGQELAESGANVHEQQYVQGLVLEYQTKVEQEEVEAEQKKQKNEVSDGARNDLKNVMGKNKKIDDAEARQVLDMIKNVRGNYSKAEIEFFKQELIKAGFGALLLELEDESKVNNADIVPTETPDDKEMPPDPETPVNSETPVDTPSKSEEPHRQDEEPIETGNNVNRPITKRTGKFKPIETPNTPPKSEPASSTSVEPKDKNAEKTNPTNTHITESAQSRGKRIADDLFKETNGTWADNDKVHQLIKEVNSNTAYSFLVEYTHEDKGNKLTVTKDVYGLSDMFNKITAGDAKHLTQALLDQAKGMGLENTQQYKELASLQNGMKQTLHGNTDPDTDTQNKLDKSLTALINQMKNVIR